MGSVSGVFIRFFFFWKVGGVGEEVLSCLLPEKKRKVPVPSLSGMALQSPQTLLEIGSSISLQLPRERNNTKWLFYWEKYTRCLISCKK